MANVVQLQQMHPPHKHFPMPTSYYLDEYTIQQSQSATYLGVTIDQEH